MPRTHFLISSAYAASLLVSCGQATFRIDGGPDRDGSLTTGTLRIESETSLALVFGEDSELAVLYTEEGEPVSGVPIRFALDGLAHDSTVTDLVVSTDDRGRARTSLIAGSTATVFRVRITAERAAPAYVDVSVGNMGFGSLRIGAAYEGSRQGGVRRVIQVYAEHACEDELPPFMGLMVTLDDPLTAEARFRALPAGLRYAVLGHLEAAGGLVLSRACTDTVEIAREAETRIELAFADEPLRIEGVYDVSVTLDPSASSEAVVELARATGSTIIELAGSDAALYLDVLEAELRERGELALADGLALQRLDGTADASLAAELEAAAEGPTLALLVFLNALRARLTVLELAGPLSLTLAASALDGAWSVSALSMGRSGIPDSPPLSVDPLAAGFALDPALSVRWSTEDDAMSVDALRVTLELGTLTHTLIETEAASRGHDSVAKLMLEDAGCGALASWVASSETLGPACDGECVMRVCLIALGEIVGAVEATAPAIDASRDRVALSGSIVAHDEDGDLRVDRLIGEGLEGRWTSAIDEIGDAVGASIAGQRVMTE